jgi:transposase InsO family protein
LAPLAAVSRLPPLGKPGSVERPVLHAGRSSITRLTFRDRDRVYSEAFTRRIRGMGIRDRPTAPRSPWQNGNAERLIGSIRRECLDHVVFLSERHLRQCPALMRSIITLPALTCL